MKTYGQYCPIARGAEVFAERWTPLIVRNLHLGAETFSEIQQGIPHISKTLLSSRLRALERQGVLERRPGPGGRGSRYGLTPAGEELADVTWALGNWGARWLEVSPEHSDPLVVLWAWKNEIRRERLPDRRIVIRFDLRDRPKERYWLLFDDGRAEVCVKPPGGDDDLVVTTDAVTLMLVHMGRLSIAQATDDGLWEMAGSATIARRFPTWGGLSRFASVEPARAS